MKYPNTKRDRNNAICYYHKTHPEVAMRELAEMHGISTARVSAIIQRENNLKADRVK